MEYLTRYPKTVSLAGGIIEKVRVDAKSGVENLQVIVKKNAAELAGLFKKEGFTNVKFEHKKPKQIGHGLNLKLKKPWEMHIRFVEIKKGLTAIQGEVEVSRDYFQHLFGQSTPVIYEIEAMLKKHQVDYKIWNTRISKYVQNIMDDYKISLATPNIPVFAWKPMVAFIGTVGVFYLWKYINTI